MGRPQHITDDELLEIARECFMEAGFAVATQVIADKAGISQPAIFKRFGTKEELFLRALAPPERIPVLDWIDSHPSPGDFEPQLTELLEKIWETLQWVIPRVLVLAHSNITPEKFLERYKVPPLMNLILSINGYLDRAQEQGHIRKDCDTATMAQALLGALQGRALIRLHMRMDFGQPEDAAYIASTCDLLMRGMKSEGNEQ